ncbi:hypothetical protein BDP27DRAFT_1366122 [Rhodocollybia butyracea]|uniref:Uncharacterized protein n=1 Tax=Rhodocollybia butyracea TaxID=206335 RepID=A0A9P5PMG5_9AGAR|nr:hypothetical protein BDP27DRAFT_1366122 [Rhodocollybia butyracea]
MLEDSIAGASYLFKLIYRLYIASFAKFEILKYAHDFPSLRSLFPLPSNIASRPELNRSIKTQGAEIAACGQTKRTVVENMQTVKGIADRLKTTEVENYNTATRLAYWTRGVRCKLRKSIPGHGTQLAIQLRPATIADWQPPGSRWLKFQCCIFPDSGHVFQL